MNTPWPFIPSLLCALVILFGGLCTGAMAFALKRTRPGRSTRTGLKCVFVLGLVAVLIGFSGLWLAGFSVGWAGYKTAEWSDGRAPELEVLVRKHCLPFISQRQTVGMVVALASPTNAALMAFGKPALSSMGQTRPDTFFEIGAATTTFTATALAREIEQGTVQLDQRVQELLPAGVQLPQPAQNVTLRQLATHSSGFPRLPGNLSLTRNGLKMRLLGSDPYAGYTEQDFLDGLRTVKLEFTPGKQSLYSNFGVTLLGYLLAKRTGVTYDALIKRDVCRPLRMEDTTVTLDRAQAGRVAQGYRVVLRLGPILFGLRSDPWFKANDLGGAGALRSTGADMLKYLKANMHPEGQPIETALRESHRELFRDDAQTTYAMNWVRSRQKQPGQTVIWHNGATGGFHSFIGFTEDGRAGVLILSNTSESVDGLAMAMLLEALEVSNVEEGKGFSKTGRNDPCPCGSGKKFKKCCGK